MTLAEQSASQLRDQDFTASDIRAIFAIMEALPYSARMYHVGILSSQFFDKEVVLVEEFTNQLSAIARAYKTTFKDAAERKEIYPR